MRRVGPVSSLLRLKVASDIVTLLGHSTLGMRMTVVVMRTEGCKK